MRLSRHAWQGEPQPLLRIDNLELHTASRAGSKRSVSRLNPFNTAGIGARPDALGSVVVNPIAG
jgi:hypothetical protein